MTSYETLNDCPSLYCEGALECERRIAVIADAHIDDVRYASSNPRLIAEMRLEAFIRALALIERSGITRLVVVGDMFGKVVVPPWIVSGVSQALASFGGHTMILAGNHDTDIRQSALSYLADISGVSVCHAPTRFGMVGSSYGVLVPYVPAWRTTMVFDGIPAEEGLGGAIFGHFGVVDAASPTWLRKESLAVTMAELEAFCDSQHSSLAVVGHYHDASVRRSSNVPLRVITVGALNPTDANQCGPNYGNIAVLGWDGDIWKADLFTQCVTGVRYAFGEVAKALAADGNWVMVTEPMAVEMSIPDELEDAYGALTAHYSQVTLPDGGAASAAIATTDVDGAVAEYALSLARTGKLSGDALGLVDDALSRLRGVERVSTVPVAPEVESLSRC